MSMKPFHHMAVLCALAFGLHAAPGLAQTVSQKGMAMVPYGKRLNATERQQALAEATFNALEQYVAESDSSQDRLFESRHDYFAGHVSRYVLSTTVLSQQDDPQAKTYTVVLRADINEGNLTSDLGVGTASEASVQSTNHQMLTFLFMARSQKSIQQFDDRVYKRVDSDTIQSRDTTQGESIRAHSIKTSDGIDTHKSVRSVSGGSTVVQADKVTWQVAQSDDINTAMTGVFANAGYQVIDADQVEGASNGLLNIDSIRAGYSSGDDLPPKLMYQTTQGVHTAGIGLLAIGTLDIGMPGTDPVSGNVRVYVTVTAKVYNVSGRFAATLASVGPVQFAGLGPNATVAQTNALTMAARETAQHLVDELANRGVH
ncbi:MAG: hypothetical protein WAM52_14230 [Steroidobacteraceae bacterium]